MIITLNHPNRQPPPALLFEDPDHVFQVLPENITPYQALYRGKGQHLKSKE